MPWSAQYDTKADFDADEPIFSNVPDGEDAVEQIKATRKHAKELITKKVLGTAVGDNIKVSIGGHNGESNPRNPGYAKRSITVQIVER